MKVVLLADSNSTHTIKWAKSLADHNIKVCIVGLSECRHNFYDNDNISTYSLGVSQDLVKSSNSSFNKITYAFLFLKVKRIIKQFSPDLVHAHYATSYGLIGVLSGFKQAM